MKNPNLLIAFATILSSAVLSQAQIVNNGLPSGDPSNIPGPSGSTDWSSAWTVPQFDPANGVITGITLTFTGDYNVTYLDTPRLPAPSTAQPNELLASVTYDHQATTTFSAPGLGAGLDFDYANNGDIYELYADTNGDIDSGLEVAFGESGVSVTATVDPNAFAPYYGTGDVTVRAATVLDWTRTAFDENALIEYGGSWGRDIASDAVLNGEVSISYEGIAPEPSAALLATLTSLSLLFIRKKS